MCPTVTEKPRYVLTDEMNREDWLKCRQQGIGGSDAGAVLGLSSFKTQYDIWVEKTAPHPIDAEETRRMYWGKKLEAALADGWAELTGMKVRVDNKVRFHPDIPYLLVNLDRTIVQIDDRGPGILECKTADKWTQSEWENGIPRYYYAQVQHEMLVTGYKWGELYVLFGGNEDRRYEFHWDDEFIKEVLPIYQDFWVNHVQSLIAPAPRTNGDINQMYPDSSPGLTLTATPETLKLIEEASHLKELAADFTSQKEEVYIQIKAAMKTADRLVDGEGVILATFSGKNGSRRLNLK